MKRYLLFCAILVLLFAQVSDASMSYGANHYRQNKGRVGAGNYNVDPIWLFMNETEGLLEGTGAVDSIYFNPTTAPTAAEGLVYYNDASDVLMLYTGASVWKTIDTAGASSLGTAYTVGSKITAPTLEVEIEVADSSNNPALRLDFDDVTTNAQDVLVIDNAGDDAAAVSIQINGSAGYDIQGTGDVWKVSYAGVGTFVGTVIGASDLTFENAEFIDNGTNNKIIFDSDTSTVEDIAIGLGANTNIITLTSGSGANKIEYDTVDDANGVGNIYFDSAASQITLAANEDADDLTVQVTGALNASLDLRSAGTGADAVKIYGSAGGIDIDGTGSTLTITNTANGADDDITINAAGTSQDSSLILTSDGVGGDAVSIITTNTLGDIKVNSADMIDIDAADKIDITIAGAATEDFVVTNTGGSIILTATEDIADGIYLHATTGGIDILADGAAAKDLDLTCTNGSVIVTGGEAHADAIKLNASAGGVNIDAATAYDVAINGGQVLIASVDAVASAIALTANVGASETIVVTNTQGTGTGAIDLTATAGGINIDAADAKILDIDAGSIHIDSKTAGATAITLTTNQGATDQMVVTNTQGTNEAAIKLAATAGGVDIDASTGKNVAINGGQILIEAEDNSTNAISLKTNTGTTETIVILNSQGNTDASIDIDSTAGGLDVDVAKGLLLTSSEGSADSVVITSTGGGIDILAATTDAGSEDIDITLSGATDSSIILTSSGTAADAIKLHSNGGTSSGVYVHSQTGTGADAIKLYSQVGGTTILADGATTGNILIDGENKITIVSTDLDAEGIYIHENSTSGSSGTIKIHADKGTAEATGASSITLLSDDGGINLKAGALTSESSIWIESIAGGVNIDAAAGKDVDIDGGQILLEANHNVASAISLITNTGTTETIVITNTLGDTEPAIGITSSAGGVKISANAAKDIDIDGGQVLINSAHNVASSIALTVDTGAAATMVLTNTPCTTKDAITLSAVAGGINIDAAEDIDIQVNSNAASEDLNLIQTGAQDAHILISATGTSIDAIKLHSNGGTGAGIYLHQDAGTAVTDAAASIQLTSDVGGIGIKATAVANARAIVLDAPAGGVIVATSAAHDVDIDTGQFLVNTTHDVANAIALTAGSAGTNDTIVITNTPGTAEGAIELTSTAGGIDLNAATGKDIALTGGQITILSNENVASAISLTTNTNTAETIVVTNTQGTDVAAIGLTATAGGVTVTATKPLKLETCLAVNDVRTIAQDDATPDVSGYSYFNTGTNADTIDDFDGANIEEGQIIIVVSKAAITYDIDGGLLIAGTTDLVTASGDVTMWLYDGTNWRLISWIDNAVDQNGRG